MTKQKEKNSFILYSDHEELFNELSNDDAAELVRGLFRYNTTGEIPNLAGMAKMAFISIRQDMDRNKEKYEEIREQRRIAGQKGAQQRIKALKETKKSVCEDTETQDSDKQVSAKQANAKSAKNDISKSGFYVNDNVNVNVDDNLSISKEERELLENYIRKNKLATKSIRAYANKIIERGDHIDIIEKEKKKKMTPELRDEKIKQELSSIVDKKSCAKVLGSYYMRGSPPDEFNEISVKYDLDTYDKVEQYLRDLHNEKLKKGKYK